MANVTRVTLSKGQVFDVHTMCLPEYHDVATRALTELFDLIAQLRKENEELNDRIEEFGEGK
jgi:hypothetical protein